MSWRSLEQSGGASPTTLSFDKGTILVRGESRVPYTSWDTRVKAFRAPGIYYPEIAEYLKRSRGTFIDQVQNLVPCPRLRSVRLVLRDYQRTALKRWEEAGRRGIIVLPTGSGKTEIAMKAIELVNQATIVIVPTLDLMEQWRNRLEAEFKVETGAYGGGDVSIRPITVSTYDSAYLKAAVIGNMFGLIVFDETHHLPSEGFRQIAEMFTAPSRLGLTATYEREDMLHLELPRLTGGVVYRLRPDDLAGTYLAPYKLQRMNVELTEDERKEYETNYKVFTDYLDRTGTWITSPIAFQHFIMKTGRDKEARRALLGRNKALNIALNSESKLSAIEKILSENPDEKCLIFTQHNDLVYRISRRFLLPFITYTTEKEERREVLQRFKDGMYRAIVTSKVLDEGIDVPEASLGIIVSGTGSSREFIQRLGRLLRKKGEEGKEARLIEIVSRATSEARFSTRRKREPA